jgi:NADPH:quinone reductase-like Zn-dependent oxidoreductase
VKAAFFTKYGNPEVLKLQEVDKPLPLDDEILVKIIPTTVNSGDVRVRGLAIQGILKLVMQFVLGFNKLRKPILGNVLSGIVKSAGDKVSHFKPGDKVFGMTGFKFGTRTCPSWFLDRSS